jgi:hypothetical protein
VDTFAFNAYNAMGPVAGTKAYLDDVKRGVIADDPKLADAIKRGACHPRLDPKGVKFRESRDSDAHPQAVPIAILLDVTGSMQAVPRTIQAALPQLMGLLIRRGYCDHPAIMVGAIGDATCDRVPLQVGQFESGIEVEDDLTNLYLEGGGGGHITESYELALYFMARHTVTDHWEKRQQRGYLFTIGDEIPYSDISPSQLQRIIDDPASEVIPTARIAAELQERWECFHILPNLTSHWQDSRILEPWRKLFGQNVIELDNPEAICECIAAQIGLFEARVDDVAADLVKAGVSGSVAAAVGRAIVPASAGRAVAQTIPSSGAGSGLVAI